MIIRRYDLSLVTFQVLLILCLFTSMMPVNAIEYYFVDDFATDFDSWQVISKDLTTWGSGDYPVVNHTFEIVDGVLRSGGDLQPNYNQRIFTSHNTTFGVWSIDVKVPENITGGNIDYSWGMFINDKRPTLNSTDTEGEDVSDLRFFFRSNRMIDFNSASSTIVNISHIESPATWHTYELIRPEDKILVFIDEEKVIETSYFGSLVDLQYISIGTYHGSNIEFDNVRISNDYEGRLAELEPSNEIIPEDASEDARVNILIFVAGGVVIATSATVLSYRYFKKKELKK